MKVAIYCRVSTQEQDPTKQISECEIFCESRGYEVEGIYKEELSGFKDIKRPNYELIKEKARRGEINGVVVWSFDRWVRNRDTLLEDVSILSQYNCKLHSVKDAWLEAINVEGSLGKTIREFLLGLLGSIAQMESERRSERMKMAFVSHKGKKWGRKPISQKVIDNVLDLYNQKVSLRQISKKVTYYDKNGNLKYLSLGAVWKILNKGKNDKKMQGL